MTVVINNFEVVVEPNTSPDANQSSGGSQPAQSAPPRPEDVEHIVQHFQERRARVMAD